jgi:subtilisin-like proprotein convertase family protein
LQSNLLPPLKQAVKIDSSAIAQLGYFMPALQSSDQRSYSQRRLVLEVLESRLTPTRAWFESSDLPLHINGSTSLQAEVVVNRSVTIQDIDIWLNLDHAKPDELNLTLISPAGTEIRLITGRGGNGTGFHDTIIDDQAQQSLNSTTIISGQRYRPEESLATLENEQAQGAWHLRIQDNNPLDNTGTLYSFWLGITSPPDDHGDSTTNASSLLQAASSLFSESGNIEIAGDHDWFSWTATKDCFIQINLDAANNSSLDTYLTQRILN